MARVYTAEDGTQYPLTEARYDMMFRVYRSDRRRCKKLDPHHCFLAMGIRRHPDVVDVYIGSGCDAYVVFAASEDEPAHAVHFGIRTKQKRIIDAFDNDASLQSQDIILCKPPHSWRLDVRRDSNKRRREEVKNGSPVKSRGTIAKVRMNRVNVGRRPSAPLSKGGNVNTAA